MTQVAPIYILPTGEWQIIALSQHCVSPKTQKEPNTRPQWFEMIDFGRTSCNEMKIDVSNSEY